MASKDPNWSPDQSLYKKVPNDARDYGMVYPNYNIIRTPTGHNLTLDDSAGAESVTLQHATGSSIQFLQDGTSVYRSEGSTYEVVFGEKTVIVSGSVNLVINGQCDTKIMGDYNLTVMGNMRTAVGGNIETVVGADDVLEVAGTKETVIGGSTSMLVKGPIETMSDDRIYLGSKNDFKVQSIEKKIFMQAGDDIRALAGANVAIESTANTDIKSGRDYNLQSVRHYAVKSGGKITMSSVQKATFKSTNFVGMDGLKIFFNSNISDEAGDAKEA